MYPHQNRSFLLLRRESLDLACYPSRIGADRPHPTTISGSPAALRSLDPLAVPHPVSHAMVVLSSMSGACGDASYRAALGIVGRVGARLSHSGSTHAAKVSPGVASGFCLAHGAMRAMHYQHAGGRPEQVLRRRLRRCGALELRRLRGRGSQPRRLRERRQDRRLRVLVRCVRRAASAVRRHGRQLPGVGDAARKMRGPHRP